MRGEAKGDPHALLILEIAVRAGQRLEASEFRPDSYGNPWLAEA